MYQNEHVRCIKRQVCIIAFFQSVNFIHCMYDWDLFFSSKNLKCLLNNLLMLLVLVLIMLNLKLVYLGIESSINLMKIIFIVQTLSNLDQNLISTIGFIFHVGAAIVYVWLYYGCYRLFCQYIFVTKNTIPIVLKHPTIKGIQKLNELDLFEVELNV